MNDVGGLAADLGKGVAVFVDEMQDLGPDDVSALCAACHEVSQSGLPVIVVGAGLPHLPAVLSAPASPTPSGCSPTSASTGSPAPRPTARSPRRPPRRTRRTTTTRWPRCTPPPAATPTSSRPTARRSGTSRPRSPITAADVAVAAPEAERELAVGFFGSRYERATPGERDYLRAMADAAGARADGRGRLGRHRRRRRRARQEAAVALTGPRRAAQEGADLLRRARPDRVHRAALRALPPRPGLAPRTGALTPARRPRRTAASAGSRTP